MLKIPLLQTIIKIYGSGYFTTSNLMKSTRKQMHRQCNGVYSITPIFTFARVADYVTMRLTNQRASMSVLGHFEIGHFKT